MRRVKGSVKKGRKTPGKKKGGVLSRSIPVEKRWTSFGAIEHG